MFSVRGPRPKPGTLVSILLLAAAPVVAGCGAGSQSSNAVDTSKTADTKTAPAAATTAAVSRTPAEAELSGCKGAVVGTYVQVGEHVNHEAMYGGNAEQAARRVRSSAALAAAIASGKRAAIEAALRRLLAGQIVRIEILEHGKTLAQVGSAAAIAPVSGTISGTSASYVLSTQSADSFVKVTAQVTGAPVVVYSSQKRLAGTIAGPPPAKVAQDGPIDYAGHKYRVTSIGGAVYPSGGLQIALFLPRAALACSGSRLQAQTDTLGSVGERIYRQEAGSPYVRATLRHIEADRSFQQAVASRNTSAIRAAIVSFFGAHIHVVRVRTYAVEPSGAQRFLYDLGGPHVLAPVHGEVRSAGKLVGRFSFAIQDDAGYLKLAHLFTGGEVLMRTGPNGTHQVMGTLNPGPASVPGRGPVNYEGHEYEAYSFTGEAFPSGALRISLLLPNRLPFGEP